MAAPDRLESDIALLRRDGHDIAVVEEQTRYHVLFNNFGLPDQYIPNVTTLMFIADYQYPLSALDMFWTEPHVRCQAGGWPLNADQFLKFIGRTWQRWSWHYAGWNPATHSVATHLEVCRDRLARAC